MIMMVDAVFTEFLACANNAKGTQESNIQEQDDFGTGPTLYDFQCKNLVSFFVRP
jgi:hypothetical protein